MSKSNANVIRSDVLVACFDKNHFNVSCRGVNASAIIPKGCPRENSPSPACRLFFGLGGGNTVGISLDSHQVCHLVSLLSEAANLLGLEGVYGLTEEPSDN